MIVRRNYLSQIINLINVVMASSLQELRPEGLTLYDDTATASI